MSRCLLVIVLFLNFSCLADNYWRTYTRADTLQIEYQHNAGKLLEIRATTVANSSIGAFLHLLEDTQNISRWVENAEKAELLAQPDAHSHIVHTYFSAIWPVSKRDMVTRSTWSQDPVSAVLTMTITDIGQQYPPVRGYVRMQQVRGQWTLTPLPGGQLQIQYQGQADPAGKLPRFISDKVALKATFTTFSRLPAALARYQQFYANIIEP